MKRLALLGASLALIGLAGCTTVTNAISDYSVSQTTIDTIMSGYDTAFLAPAKNYRDLYDRNPCQGNESVTNAQGLCAKKSVVIGLQKADKVVEDALAAAQSQLDGCKAAGATTCKGVGALYGTLRTAVAAAESYATTYGVK